MKNLRRFTLASMWIAVGTIAVACGGSDFVSQEPDAGLSDASAGGTAGLGGTAGHGGTAGKGGTSGSGGIAGSSGTAGSGGSAGAGGIAGAGGTAGAAGTSGVGGTSGSGGVAGSAGAAGSGGVAGSAGIAGAGGGVVTCSSGYTCVAAPDPGVWSRVGYMGAPATACDTTDVMLNVYSEYEVNSALNASCSCSCGTVQGACGASISCGSSTDCSTGAVTTQFGATCVGLGGSGSVGSFRCAAHPPTWSSDGGCAPFTDIGKPPIEPDHKACVNAVEDLVACTPGSVCVREKASGTVGPCVVAAGSGLTCPGLYTQKFTVFQQVQDTRGCEQGKCSCGAAAGTCACNGGTCGTQLFPGATTCTNSTPITIPNDNSCNMVISGEAGTVANVSIRLNGFAPTQGVCAASASPQPTGDVVGDSALTVCCKP